MRHQHGLSCRSFLLGVIAASVGLASPARATSGYPKVIHDELHLRAEPACTLCHRDTNGGKNTVDEPFGRWLLRNGLAGYQDGTLRALLVSMDEQGVDSDGDCVSNIDELRAGTDPNVATVGTDAGSAGCIADAVASPPPMQTGCAIGSVDRSTCSDALPFILTFGIGVTALRSRRRRR